MIRIKRVYEQPSAGDGSRILVDRLWPRGLTKAKARIDDWLKEIAPSDELRRWFQHDPKKWGEFKRRFRKELEDQKDFLVKLREKADAETITLVYGARDEEYNNAVVLKELLEEPMVRKRK